MPAGEFGSVSLASSSHVHYASATACATRGQDIELARHEGNSNWRARERRGLIRIVNLQTPIRRSAQPAIGIPRQMPTARYPFGRSNVRSWAVALMGNDRLVSRVYPTDVHSTVRAPSWSHGVDSRGVCNLRCSSFEEARRSPTAFEECRIELCPSQSRYLTGGRCPVSSCAQNREAFR